MLLKLRDYFDYVQGAHKRRSKKTYGQLLGQPFEPRVRACLYLNKQDDNAGWQKRILPLPFRPLQPLSGSHALLVMKGK